MMFGVIMAKFIDQVILGKVGLTGSGYFSSRNQEIYISYMAVDGRQGESMEKVGRPYGLTRESVRQIVNSTRSQIVLDESERDLSATLLKSIEASLPASNEALASLLHKENLISKKDFHLEGLIQVLSGFLEAELSFESIKQKDSLGKSHTF